MKKSLLYFVLSFCLLVLTGCVAEPPATTLAWDLQTAPSTTAPQPSAATKWPERPSANAELYQVHTYNGSLKLCWEGELYWIKDPSGSRYFVEELDFHVFYNATFWLRVELTEAGQHYCDESWTPSLECLTNAQYDGRDKTLMLTKPNAVPYYLDGNRNRLGGWIVFGDLRDPAVVEFTLRAEVGAFHKTLWLAPSFAATYTDQELFRVEVLEQALDTQKLDDKTYSVQWNGNVYFFAENGLMPSHDRASCYMIVTPQQWLLELEKEQTVNLRITYPGIYHLSYLPNLSAAIPLYADEAQTQWVAMYVFLGEQKQDSVALTLMWTEADGAHACSKIVYFDPK